MNLFVPTNWNYKTWLLFLIRKLHVFWVMNTEEGCNFCINFPSCGCWSELCKLLTITEIPYTYWTITCCCNKSSEGWIETTSSYLHLLSKVISLESRHQLSIFNIPNVNKSIIICRDNVFKSAIMKSKAHMVLMRSFDILLFLELPAVNFSGSKQNIICEPIEHEWC